MRDFRSYLSYLSQAYIYNETESLFPMFSTSQLQLTNFNFYTASVFACQCFLQFTSDNYRDLVLTANIFQMYTAAKTRYMRHHSNEHASASENFFY